MMSIDTTYFVLPISILWWGLYFARIRRIMGQPSFFTMPRLYLWLNLYGAGLIYYLHHYTIEQRLQEQLDWTGLPIISLVKVLVSTGFVTYGYILVVRRYTRLTVSRKIDGLMITMLVIVIVMNFALYGRVPYLKLQILTNTLVSATNLCAAVSLLPMTRTLLRSHKSQVREAHHLWFVTFLVASSFAVILFFIDGLYKLLTDWMVINSPLFVIGEAVASIYLLALAFLFGPDRFLYWIYYPNRLLTYRKLKRLADRIHHEADIEAVYTIPMPRIPTLSVVELATYRLFILILDSYAHLDAGSDLRHRLCEVDRHGAPYEESIRQLAEIAGIQE